MSVQLTVESEESPVLCRMLRTKATHGTLENIAAPWKSTTASYRCLATMEAFGPDDAFAHADACREGRECFRKPVPE